MTGCGSTGTSPIAMDDGLVLRADVFRPDRGGPLPGDPDATARTRKGLPFQEGYPSAWKQMADEHPDVTAGSTNKYQQWEVVDPEKWVPDGYACVRVDSRGTGRSPGLHRPLLPARDAGTSTSASSGPGAQGWSNGKVGLNGISYYAINQWHVAALQPPHLAAMCVWEGAADWYRDMTHHGGISRTFWANWYDMQVKTRPVRARRARAAQPGHGRARLRRRDALRRGARRRTAPTSAPRSCAHPLDDEYHRARSPTGKDHGAALVRRRTGAGRACTPAATSRASCAPPREQKWLEVHGIEHWTHFYTDYGRELQRRFFDYFLKGEDNGWSSQPQVLLQRPPPGRALRGPRGGGLADPAHASGRSCTSTPDGERLADERRRGRRDGRVRRAWATAYVLARRRWTRSTRSPARSRRSCGSSSSTSDADLFLVVRVFDPDGEEVVFRGAVDPHTPIAPGLAAGVAPQARSRAHAAVPAVPHPRRGRSRSRRARSTSSTSRSGPRRSWSRAATGSRSRCAAGTTSTPGPGARLSNFKNELKGCGPFLHDEPATGRRRCSQRGDVVHGRRSGLVSLVARYPRFKIGSSILTPISNRFKVGPRPIRTCF